MFFLNVTFTSHPSHVPQVHFTLVNHKPHVNRHCFKEDIITLFWFVLELRYSEKFSPVHSPQITGISTDYWQFSFLFICTTILWSPFYSQTFHSNTFKNNMQDPWQKNTNKKEMMYKLIKWCSSIIMYDPLLSVCAEYLSYFLILLLFCCVQDITVWRKTADC